MSFLDQVAADFEAVTAGEFSTAATVSDGDTSIEIRCLFDDPNTSYDPDTMSTINRQVIRLTVAETAYPTFNFRRDGLEITIGDRTFQNLPSDWEYDGLGQLTLYLREL